MTSLLKRADYYLMLEFSPSEEEGDFRVSEGNWDHRFSSYWNIDLSTM